VVGTDSKDLTELLAEIRPDTKRGLQPRCSTSASPPPRSAWRSNPRDFDAFVEGVTIYHIIVEATIALTGQRFELGVDARDRLHGQEASTAASLL